MKNKKILIPIIAVVAVLIIIVSAALVALSGKDNNDSENNSEEEKKAVSLSEQEATNYNTAITNSIGFGQAVLGSDVHTIIDKIIESNNTNAGKAGLFISIDATAISQDIGVIGEGGTLDNSQEYVADCESKMETLKSYINTLKYYQIDETYDRSRNILTGITIKENAERNGQVQSNTTNETNTVGEDMQNTSLSNTVGSSVPGGTNTQSTNTVTSPETSTMTEFEKQAIETYNFGISVYAGNGKKGIDAKSCIAAIISTNTSYAGDPGRFIALNINGTTIGIAGNQNNTSTEVQNCNSQMQAQNTRINTGKLYNISVSYGADGYVNLVTITEA